MGFRYLSLNGLQSKAQKHIESAKVTIRLEWTNEIEAGIHNEDKFTIHAAASKHIVRCLL